MGYEELLNTIPRNEHEGDYRDGVLYCGTCQTPKETPVKALGGKLMPIMCECETALVKARVESADKREKEDRIRRNYDNGMPDMLYRQWTFEKDNLNNPNATMIAKAYVDNWKQNKAENRGLLFAGSVGTGKTYLACCIANALLNQGATVLVTEMATLLRRAGQFDDSIYEDMERFSLVIIDDIGVERTTDFALEQVTQIINARYKSNKPLIVTTNLTPQEMANQKQLEKRRIYDRILERCQTTVTMTGESQRLRLRRG